MKSTIVGLFLTTVFTLLVSAQTATVNIIPKPLSVEAGDGNFIINSDTKIVATDKPGKRNAEILSDILQRDHRLKLKVTSKPQKENAIVFITAVPTTGVVPNVEQYSLTVEKDFARISGSERGQFLGIQSFRQLFPSNTGSAIEIPGVQVADAPRFPYRGMHLDVARHFMPVEFVKKYIDLMSQYKFNYFHWHLTEDQGWRIEIKKYPKLTEIGSKRPETVKERNLTPYIGDGIPHGGFYTQEQIKDVVAYARERHITVIPEIELPGHASAALAAYPQLGA